MKPVDPSSGEEGGEYGEWEYSLWRRHLFMGIGSFTLGSALLLVYLLLTPHGPHRSAVDSARRVRGGLLDRALRPGRHLGSENKMASVVLLLWSVTTLVFIAAGASLDGGIGSPISALLVLPVLYAGLVYPSRTVIALAGVAAICFAVVGITSPTVNAPRSIMSGVVLGLAAGIGIMAAFNRTVQERDIQRLTNRLLMLAMRAGLTGCLTYQAFEDAGRTRRRGRAVTVGRSVL